MVRQPTSTVEWNTTASPASADANLVPRVDGFGRLSKSISGAIVLAMLIATAYWGHRTDWRFSSSRHESTKEGSHSQATNLAVVQVGPRDPNAGALPLPLQSSATITFESGEVVEGAGVGIAAAWTSTMTEAIAASGEVGFDPTLIARLSARVPGTAWSVHKSMGDSVKTGDLLAVIDAVEVGKTKAEFQQAFVQARLKQKAFTQLGTAGTAVNPRQRNVAEAATRDADVRLLGAEQALLNLGLPVRAADYLGLSLDEVVRRMRNLGVPEDLTTSPSGAPLSTNLLPIRSTLDGVVLNSDVVTGEVVDTGRVLFAVVDPHRLWLTLHVGQDELRRIALGQTVRFRPDGLSEEFSGPITWIGTTADEVTRRVPVRVELDNKVGRLRASMLGIGRIVIREEPNAIVVPNEAVLKVHGASIVFLRDPDFLKPGRPKAFHLRVVRFGASDAQNTEIISGLKPGDVVASKGANVLLNEWWRAVNESR